MRMRMVMVLVMDLVLEVSLEEEGTRITSMGSKESTPTEFPFDI